MAESDKIKKHASSKQKKPKNEKLIDSDSLLKPKEEVIVLIHNFEVTILGIV
jgi:hypothetical protein